MINVEVRAEDYVDIRDLQSRRSERIQIVVVRLAVKTRMYRCAILVVANTAVDQDGVVWGPNDIGLEAEDQSILLIQRPGRQHPAPVFAEHLGRETGQERAGRADGALEFDDMIDPNLAEVETRSHVSRPPSIPPLMQV